MNVDDKTTYRNGVPAKAGDFVVVIEHGKKTHYVVVDTYTQHSPVDGGPSGSNQLIKISMTNAEFFPSLENAIPSRDFTWADVDYSDKNNLKWKVP